MNFKHFDRLITEASYDEIIERLLPQKICWE